MPKPTTPLSKRRRWSEREARTALDSLAQSGLSMRAFALREGINHQRLFRWRSRLEARTGARSTAAPISFIEVRQEAPRTEARRASLAQIEVVLVSGRVLRCAEEIAPGVLRRIVGVLEQDPRC
jgi:transposase-like protein